MEEQIFTVSRIQGEYAILISEKDNEELFIALALLPMGTDEGTRLKYNFPDFEIIWRHIKEKYCGFLPHKKKTKQQTKGAMSYAWLFIS